MATEGSINTDILSDETFELLCSRCKCKGKTCEAEKYCVECNDYYCLTCVKVHEEIPFMSTHKIFDKGQFNTTNMLSASQKGSGQSLLAPPTERCNKHNHYYIDMYCQQHDDVGCATCIATDHRSCKDIFYIPEFLMNNATIPSSKEIAQTLDEVSKLLTKSHSTLQYEKQKLLEAKADALENIRKFRKEINDSLDKLEQNSINEIESSCKALIEQIQKAIKEVQTTQSYINSAQNKVASPGNNESQVFVNVKKGMKTAKMTSKWIEENKTQIPEVDIDFKTDQKLSEFLEEINTLGNVIQRTVKDDGNVASSVKVDGNVTSSVKDDGNLTSSVKDDGNLTSSVKNEGNVTSSVKDDGNMAKSVKDDGNVTSSVKDERNWTSSVKDEGNMASSVKDEGNVASSVKDEGNMASSVKDEGNMASSVKDEGNVASSVKDEGNVASSVKDEGNMASSVKDEGNVASSVQNEGNVASSNSKPKGQQITLNKTTRQKNVLLLGHKKKIYNVKVESDKRHCDIFSACALEDGTVILSDYNNNKLKCLESSTYTVTDSYDLPGTPWQVCPISKQEVAVCLKDEQVVQFITVGSKMAKKREINTDFYCRGLAYANDNLYISDLFRSVYIYSMGGSKLGQINHDQPGQGLFSSISSLAVSKDGSRIYVADFNKGLIVLDKNGQVVGQFNNPQFKGAYGCYLTDTGSVIVSEYSTHNILQFGPDGELIGEVVKSIENKAFQTVCCNQQMSKLIVGSRSNEIEVYDLEY